MLKGYHSAPWSQASSGVCVWSGGRRSVWRFEFRFSSLEFRVLGFRQPGLTGRKTERAAVPGGTRLSAYTLILLYTIVLDSQRLPYTSDRPPSMRSDLGPLHQPKQAQGYSGNPERRRLPA